MKFKFYIIIIIILVILIIIGFFLKNNKEEINIKGGNNIRISYTTNESTDNNDEIALLDMYLKDDELDRINSLIKRSSFKKVDTSIYKGTNTEIGIVEQFEVTIDNDIVLSMDKEFSIYKQGNDLYIIYTPKELFNEISTIIKKK